MMRLSPAFFSRPATTALVRTSLPRLACAAVALLLCGCAGTTAARRPNYTVFFTASRASDQAPLTAVAVPVVLGGENDVKTGAGKARENEPAFLDFYAKLTRPKRAGTGEFQLITRVAIREVTRTRKGKLKHSKRNIGALVPTRLGENQTLNADGDPIHLEARVEPR